MKRTNPIPDYSKYVEHNSLSLDFTSSNPTKFPERITDRHIPGIIAFLQQKHDPKIEQVFLGGNLIGPEGVKYFVAHNTTATHVNFGQNPIGNAGLRKFVDEHLKNPILTDVVFSSCNLSAVGITDFAERMTTPLLVNFAGNQIGDSGLTALAKMDQDIDLYVADIGCSEKGLLKFIAQNDKVILRLGGTIPESLEQACKERNEHIEAQRRERNERAARANATAALIMGAAKAEKKSPSVPDPNAPLPPDPALAVLPLADEILKFMNLPGLDSKLKTSAENLTQTEFYKSRLQVNENAEVKDKTSPQQAARPSSSSLWKKTQTAESPEQDKKQENPRFKSKP